MIIRKGNIVTNVRKEASSGEGVAPEYFQP
jgi:hypothetical protein